MAQTTSPEISNAPAGASASPGIARRSVASRARAWVPWLLALVVLAGAGFAYWRYAKAHRPPDVQFKTAPVEARKIVGRVTASGTLQAVVTVQVGSQVSGRIQKLYADFNSTVKKGELIAKIDPQLFDAAVAQARANYTSAAASVTQAKAKALDAERVYNRTQALKEQSLASQADLDTADTTRLVARAGIDVAEASLEQNKAALHQAEVNLSYTSIHAPIDGVVISRSVDVGQTVAASLQAPVLFTIAEDLRKMQVNTNIAEGDVGRLKQGMQAYFTVDAFPGQRFSGKISQIRNAAQTLQNVVTYDAVIDVDNADLKLRPGMTANVNVVFDSREKALAVPNAALRFKPPPSVIGSVAGSDSAAASSAARGPGRAQGRGQNHSDDGTANDARTVWVLRGESAQPASIHTGLTDGTVTEVLDGLSEGDSVITDATLSGAATSSAPTSTGMRRMF
jgi:HlyD family secretion protein